MRRARGRAPTSGLAALSRVFVGSLVVGGSFVGGMCLEACVVPTVFSCTIDDHCTPNGSCVGGVCAFPDDNCDSGLRYGRYSPPSLADACVDPDLAEAETESSGASDTASETTAGADTQMGEDTESETTGPPPDVVPDGPPIVLAYYTFDQGTVEDTTVRDTSGNEHDGRLMGAEAMSFDGGVSDAALALGGNAWLELPADILSGRVTFTVELYLAVEAENLSGSRDNLFYYGDAVEQVAPPRIWALLEYIDPPTEHLRFKWTTPMGTETSLEGSTDIVNAEGWVHIALVAGPAGTELWVNHELEATDEIAPTLPDTGEEVILIGSLPDGLNDIVGRVDEVRISDRPLLPDEMLPLPPPLP